MNDPIADIMRRARDFYAIYCASSNGINFQGQPCPSWRKLPDAVRGHWYVVALRSIQLAECGQEEIVGTEPDILPNSSVLDHLGDDARVEGAIETWTRYVND